jgi:protein SCO1/2
MSVEVLRAIRYGAFVLIALIALGWLVVGLGIFRQDTEPHFGRAAIASFRLTDQDGATVTEKAILGRPAVLFFGFTYCPDICPTTLASITALLAHLGAQGDRLGVYFVTVDPDRDTAAVLKAYLSSFDRRIHGLTGTGDQIAAIARPLGVYYARSGSGDSYTMDHTASVFLLDANGALSGTIAYGEDQGVAEAKLRTLLR